MEQLTTGSKPASSLSLAEDGMKMLKGDLSKDATIKCGNRVWKVHKMILANRSEWFKKAFCGRFEEAKTGEVVIQEQEPTHVDWVITWIYTQDLSYVFDEVPGVDMYIDLSLIADYFCLDDLQSQIQHSLDISLRTMVDTALSDVKNMTYAEQEDYFRTTFSCFFEGIQKAYECDDNVTIRAFRRCITTQDYEIFCNHAFQRLCRRRVPDFHEYVLCEFIHGVDSDSWWEIPRDIIWHLDS